MNEVKIKTVIKLKNNDNPIEYLDMRFNIVKQEGKEETVYIFHEESNTLVLAAKESFVDYVYMLQYKENK